MINLLVTISTAEGGFALLLEDLVAGRERRYLWLQPEDGPRLEAATRLAVETALASPTWRVSVQTHKVLGID